MLAIMTIGVYGFDSAGFIARLQDAKVSLLLDLRQRRGVRGPQSCWGSGSPGW